MVISVHTHTHEHTHAHTHTVQLVPEQKAQNALYMNVV